MKKSLLLFVFSILSIVTLLGQITKLNYLLDHNCETGLYEVKLKILEGSAMSIVHRAQFNAQISLVVPTGTSLEIVELINPIKNNQQYAGTVPTEWDASTPALSPVGMPENDFHAFSPRLAPASFYNDIEEGDEVILFTCKIGDSEEYNPNYRFYENGNDPEFLNGGNYSNGMTIGGPVQIYNSNQYSSCNSTSTKEDQVRSITLYPNPFSEDFKVELSEDAEFISIIDYSGKQVYSSSNLSAGSVTINAVQLPTGIYMLHVKTSDSHSVKSIVKM